MSAQPLISTAQVGPATFRPGSSTPNALVTPSMQRARRHYADLTDLLVKEQFAVALLEELQLAHQIIQCATTVMNNQDKYALGRMTERLGLAPTGSTRYQERNAIITMAQKRFKPQAASHAQADACEPAEVAQ